MQITLNKKTGRISLKLGKFQYQNKITLGDILTILVDLAILVAIYHVS